MDVHLKLAANVQSQVYSGAIPGVDSVDIAFGGMVALDPFLLTGKAEVVAELPETKLPGIPIGAVGSLVLNIVKGSKLTSAFNGVCAAVSAGPAAEAQYLGRASTSGTLKLQPTVVLK